MTIKPADRIGAIAVRHPASIRVFLDHGLDFCCGGSASLEQACADQGLDPDSVIDRIREGRESTGPAARWDHEPITALVDHIVEDFHAPLRIDIERIRAMSARVVEVHGPNHRRLLDELHGTVTALLDELEEHLGKEEQVLFPWIRRGGGRTAGNPIRVMQLEHESAARMLARIREMTGDFTPPADACTTWNALYTELLGLDERLREHIHLENNILFPRALAE